MRTLRDRIVADNGEAALAYKELTWGTHVPMCHPWHEPESTDWLWNFLLSFFAPRIAGDIGPLILMIFFGMLVFGFIFVYFFIPETKGLSLEEVRFNPYHILLRF